MRATSANRLSEMIESTHGKHAMVFKNMFAMGCYLHLQGQKQAGQKLINDVIGSVLMDGVKTYLLDIRDSISGNERKYAPRDRGEHGDQQPVRIITEE